MILFFFIFLLITEHIYIPYMQWRANYIYLYCMPPIPYHISRHVLFLLDLIINIRGN